MKTWLMRRPVRRPGLARDHRAEQLVGVQAALHQQLGLALAHQLDRLRRRGMAVRRVDDPRAPRSIPFAFATPRSSPRADQDRRDQSLLAGFDRAGEQRRLLARMRHRGREPARGCGTAPAAVRIFPVPVSRVSWPHAAGAGADRRSRLLQEEGENDGQRHAVQQRLERRLVVLERHRGRRRRDALSRIPPNTGPSSALNVKFRKLTTPVAVPLISGGLASLITV